jgi:hypothetical protein
MLWLRSWKELRYRVLLAVMTMTMLLYSNLWTPALEPAPEKIQKVFLLVICAFGIPVMGKILAGCGINSQTSMGLSRGFHGSVQFLLSLPVSRNRILAVRAVLGLFFFVLVVLASFLVADLSGKVQKVWEYLPNTMCFSLFIYSSAVWLSTFLDEFWAGSVGLMGYGFLMGFSLTVGDTWLNILNYIQSPIPLNPVTMTMALLLGTIGFLLAAAYVVNHKEY